jgi:hypothetical protein
MRSKLFAIFSVLCFQFGFSQEMYLHIGENFTTYNYKNSNGATNSNIKSSSGKAYELGYEYDLNDKFSYLGSLTWNQYNAKGSNGASLYSWNTNYFGVQNAISYTILKTQNEFEINLKAGLNASTIVNGHQLLNNSYYNLKHYEEFKGILFQPLIGMQLQYTVADYLILSLNYNFSKSIPKKGLESLSFSTNQLQLGLHFPL